MVDLVVCRVIGLFLGSLFIYWFVGLVGGLVGSRPGGRVVLNFALPGHRSRVRVSD